LSDGRVIAPDDVLGEPQRGIKLCFVGDVSHTGPLHKIVEGADALIIEATYLEEDKELARQHGHITAGAAARLARNAQVKHLLLHHVSRRYRRQDIVEEAAAIFADVHVVNDFDRVQIRRDQELTLTNLRR
ncbi:MAG: ribonuclease Z, partial [Caldilineaceae bacterium]|nr:ribonuclease Z [Caldilineaceae bacterium]